MLNCEEISLQLYRAQLTNIDLDLSFLGSEKLDDAPTFCLTPIFFPQKFRFSLSRSRFRKSTTEEEEGLLASNEWDSVSKQKIKVRSTLKKNLKEKEKYVIDSELVKVY